MGSFNLHAQPVRQYVVCLFRSTLTWVAVALAKLPCWIGWWISDSNVGSSPKRPGKLKSNSDHNSRKLFWIGDPVRMRLQELRSEQSCHCLTRPSLPVSCFNCLGSERDGSVRIAYLLTTMSALCSLWRRKTQTHLVPLVQDHVVPSVSR